MYYILIKTILEESGLIIPVAWPPLLSLLTMERQLPGGIFMVETGLL